MLSLNSLVCFIIGSFVTKISKIKVQFVNGNI